MKKILIILLFVGAISQESQAKIQAGVGIKVGPAFGRWNNEFQKSGQTNAGGTLTYLVGLHAGIQGRIWFNKFVGINLAGEFNMVGNKYKGTRGTTITTVTNKENQITIPLTAMVGWGNERLRVFGNFGGYFGYAFNGKEKTTVSINGSVATIENAKSDYKNTLQNIDAGVRLGLGLQVYVDKKLKSCFTFDLNYDYGFIKVFRHGTPTYYNKADRVKLTNSKLMIGVGFLYTFGKSQAEEAPKRLIVD